MPCTAYKDSNSSFISKSPVIPRSKVASCAVFVTSAVSSQAREKFPTPDVYHLNRSTPTLTLYSRSSGCLKVVMVTLADDVTVSMSSFEMVLVYFKHVGLDGKPKARGPESAWQRL